MLCSHVCSSEQTAKNIHCRSVGGWCVLALQSSLFPCPLLFVLLSFCRDVISSFLLQGDSKLNLFLNTAGPTQSVGDAAAAANRMHAKEVQRVCNNKNRERHVVQQIELCPLLLVPHTRLFNVLLVATTCYPIPCFLHALAR